MKKFYFAVFVAAMFAATSCEKISGTDMIEDVPSIEFYEDYMTVSAEGGEVIIPLHSTGVDHVSLDDAKNWITDENGDLIPVDGWIEVVKVINEYDKEVEATRALAQWDSAIVIRVEPNDLGCVRQAKIFALSFTKSDSILICQDAQ